jgi:hypothetical protein
MASISAAAGEELADRGDQHQPVQHGDAEQRDEADAAEIENGSPVSQSATRRRRRERDAVNTHSASSTRRYVR